MKKSSLTIIALATIIGFSGCAPQLPTMFEKSTYKKYKSFPNHKALAYAKSKTTGYYVSGICKNMKTESEAQECALAKCKKTIQKFMQISESECKVYDLNDKVIWK